jgi:hypothetical protein
MADLQLINTAVHKDIFASEEAGAIKYLKELSKKWDAMPNKDQNSVLEVDVPTAKVKELILGFLNETPVMGLLEKLRIEN